MAELQHGHTPSRGGTGETIAPSRHPEDGTERETRSHHTVSRDRSGDAAGSVGREADGRVVVDGGHVETTEAEDPAPVPDISTTPSGLPVRVPQANLAEPLRSGEAVVADRPDEEDDPGRSPEEIKRIMGSYQRGTRRGRTDAAEALGGRAEEGEEDQ